MITIRWVLMFGLAMLLAWTPAVAEEWDALVARGKELFVEHGCYGCHTLGKMGTRIAPDLSRVGAAYEGSYRVRWLRDPESQKPTAHMPKIDLTEAETRALAAYLSTLR